MDELVKVLIANGPMGVVAGIMFYLLLSERAEHKETRKILIEQVSKYDELVSNAVASMTKISTLVSERLPNRNNTNP